MLPSTLQARRLSLGPSFCAERVARSTLVVRAATAVPAKVRKFIEVESKLAYGLEDVCCLLPVFATVQWRN